MMIRLSESELLQYLLWLPTVSSDISDQAQEIFLSAFTCLRMSSTSSTVIGTVLNIFPWTQCRVPSYLVFISFSAVKTEEKYSLKNLPISSTQRWQLRFLRGPIYSRVTLSCLMYIKPLWISICQSYLLLPLCFLISFLSKLPRGYILSNIISWSWPNSEF